MQPLTISTLRASSLPRRSLFWLLCGLLISAQFSADDASAKRRKRRKSKPKEEVVTVSPEVIKNANMVFTALNTTTNAEARLAVIKGLVELGGEHIEKGLDLAAKSPDFRAKVYALTVILSDKKAHKQRFKAAYKEAERLFLSAKDQEHTAGRDLLAIQVKGRKFKRLWKRALKSGGEAAQYGARAFYIKQGGKQAWRVVQAALKLPQESRGYKQALEAVREHKYKQARKWALKNSGVKGPAGEVAQVVIDAVGGRDLKGINAKLYKEYLWAAGDRNRQADFPRRVRLANILAQRGMITQVVDTLEVAIRNKRGRIRADLDSAEIRVMGWDGLRFCRDREILRKAKQMIIELQNSEEAAPAARWLLEWVQDNNDPYPMKILEEMMVQSRYVSRLEALKALGTLKVRRVRPQVLKIFNSGDKQLRLAAAEALARMIEPGDETEFYNLLRDNRNRVDTQEILLRGLFELGTPATLESFRNYLKNREVRLRRISARGIVGLNLGQQKLERFFSKRLILDSDLELRLFIWEALLKVNSGKLKRSLKRAASWLSPEALRKIAKYKAVGATFLQSMALQRNEEISQAALDILEERGAQATQDLRVIFEQSPEIKTKVRSLSLLAEHLKEQGVELYLKALKDRDEEVRVVGFTSLRRFGAKTTLDDVLTAMQNERRPQPRAEAARAYIAISKR